MGSPLLCFGTDLLSHVSALYAPSGYVSIGTEVARQPVANINNGVLGVYGQITAPSGAGFALNLRRAESPDIAVAFNQNWETASEVRLQSSASADFSALTLDLVVPVIDIDVWVDLRPLAPTARQYWRWKVTGHPTTPTLGEFVLASLTRTCPDLRWGYRPKTWFVGRDHGTTKLNVRHRRAYGSRVSTREQMTFVGTDAQLQPLVDLVHYTQRERWPFLFIPDEDADEVRWMEVPGEVRRRHLEANRYEMTLDMMEQGHGVIDDA